MSTALFQRGQFRLASGRRSWLKIECDALTEEDWDSLAALAYSVIPPFARVAGVPTGGAPFARALEPYALPNSDFGLLVCDDVLTTGTSLAAFVAAEKDVVASVVAFARGPLPPGVIALFTMARR